MKVFGILRIAANALLRNRARSLLTMLGVVIGVAAVIVTVAIGAGARTSVASQINGLGSNMLILLPGSINQGGARTGNGGASSLSVADGLALAQLPHIAAVSPTATLRAQIVAAGNNWQTTVTGVAPSYTFIRTWPMASGSFFSQTDITGAAKVAVLGQTVVSSLFPDGANPLGRSVLIRNVPFVVVGTLAAKGQSGVGQDQDDTILIPYSSALQRLTGQTTVGSMLLSADDAANVALAQSEATTLLEQRHHVAPGAPDDFMIRNLADIASAASATAAVMQMLLAGVAAVSLLVGGIGIMNIMLVSVTERTREIGLRVAVGARRKAILWQFLIEAVLLSTAGGALGVLFGALTSLGVALFAHWPATIPPVTVAVAVAFSALVGVFFGYYPAAKASRLDPIVALRFE
ncbi:MAG: ABC transporter permease [Candidatus Eremiobacteraeota bacterium]|nr:ABC transporter permease [Candidatus Eremiobacteraeota bacterium]